MRKRSSKKNAPKKNYLPALFFLNSILWFMYGIYIYYDMAVLNKNTGSADIVTIFVFVNSVFQFISGLLLRKFEAEPFYFALVVVGLNMLLMLANLFDLFFFAAFVLDLVILLMLFQLRKDYLSKS